jgi:hypothetical protein
MVLFQALLAVLRRSLGKIFEAVFGWAVYALFGQVPKQDRALLSAATGAAAVWPLLVLGVFLPRAAAAILAFLPIPKGMPAEIVRIVWILLAVSVPVLVGLAFGRRGKTKLSRGRRMLLGLPITVGLGAAFVILCVATPIAKVLSLVQGRKQEHVVLIVPPGRYDAVAADLEQTLARGGMPVRPGEAPWHVRALGRLMRRLGGPSLAAYIPERIAVLEGEDLEATLYPGGVALSGAERTAARAHSLIVERAARTEALQTTDPDAQAVERHIKTLWRELDGGGDGKARRRELDALFVRIADVDVGYEDWESIYRQALQLSLAARGGGFLLERAVEKRAPERVRDRRRRRLARSARGYAQGKALSSAGGGVAKLAEKFARKVLSGRRWGG